MSTARKAIVDGVLQGLAEGQTPELAGSGLPTEELLNACKRLEAWRQTDPRLPGVADADIAQLHEWVHADDIEHAETVFRAARILDAGKTE